MRRAKKRCRPLWRTVVVRTFQAIGILILCQIIYLAWFLTGKPAVTIDYLNELNRIARPAADESQNAEPLYRQAAELFEKSYDPNDTQNIKELTFLRYNEATPQQKALIQDWLDKNSNILDLINQGSQKPYYWPKYGTHWPKCGTLPGHTELISIQLPPLAPFRDLVRILCWRSRLLVEKDQLQPAFADIQTSYRLGLHFQGKKLLIEQLVGMDIRRISTTTLVNILYEHKTDPAILADLQKDFQHLASRNAPAIDCSTEKLFMYDEAQRCFTHDRLGGGHLYLKRIRDVGEMDIIIDEKLFVNSLHVLFTHPNKQQTLKTANQLYAFWDKMSCKTPAQLRKEDINLEKQAMDIIKGNILIRIFMPALWKLSELHHRSVTDTQAALAIIALVRYQQEKGFYPESMAELQAVGYLQELPIDPYSDQPLIYKKTADSFILYSISQDFSDDHGKPAENAQGNRRTWPYSDSDSADAVFWPPQQ